MPGAATSPARTPGFVSGRPGNVGERGVGTLAARIDRHLVEPGRQS